MSCLLSDGGWFCDGSWICFGVESVSGIWGLRVLFEDNFLVIFGWILAWLSVSNCIESSDCFLSPKELADCSGDVFLIFGEAFSDWFSTVFVL